MLRIPDIYLHKGIIAETLQAYHSSSYTGTRREGFEPLRALRILRVIGERDCDCDTRGGCRPLLVPFLTCRSP